MSASLIGPQEIYHHLKGKRYGLVEALQMVCRRKLYYTEQSKTIPYLDVMLLLREMENELKTRIDDIDIALQRVSKDEIKEEDRP